METIVIAGGTGFLGKNLGLYFKSKGDQVIILSRGEKKEENGIIYEQWDGATKGIWSEWINKATIIINLTGKSVDCRYTDLNKQLIMNSRVDSTRLLGELISKSPTPPKLWINASTATIYRHSEDKMMTEENGEIGDDFSMNVAKNWEKEFYKYNTPKTRQVALRTSLVLGSNGGVYPVLSKLVKFGLGGKQGSGKQKFAWLHIQDFINIVDFVIHKEQLSGSINTTAPSTIDNKEFMSALRKSLGHKCGLSHPKWLLKIGAFFIRTEAELVLKSRWIYPQILIDNGFKFKFEDIDLALKDLKTNN